MIYAKTVGRLELRVPAPSEGSPQLIVPDGWNDSMPKITHAIGYEELHDLRYMLDRAIDALDRWKADMAKKRKYEYHE